MREEEIANIARILARWNPLGEAAASAPGMQSYRTEALDIISALEVFGRSERAERIVRDVLNQAFCLSLTTADCAEPAKKILGVLRLEGQPPVA